MTIIAFKDGVMAADGGCFNDDIMIRADLRKIVRAPDGSLAACVGRSSVIAIFERFFREPGATNGLEDGVSLHFTPTNLMEGDFAALVAKIDGTVLAVNERGHVWRCDESAPAMGAGAPLARGAMLHGASAEQAVRLCVEHHAFCAGTVQVERLKPAGTESKDDEISDTVKWADLPGAYGDGATPKDQSWLEKQGLR